MAPPVAALSRARTSSDRFFSGAPERPPAPHASTCSGLETSPVRAMVVLVAMMPSSFRSSASRATSSMSSSLRSGAIFTSRGTCRPAALSAASPTAASSGRRVLTSCSNRRPGVFGELTLTTR